jgi:hypothetical protein
MPVCEEDLFADHKSFVDSVGTVLHCSLGAVQLFRDRASNPTDKWHNVSFSDIFILLLKS